MTDVDRKKLIKWGGEKQDRSYEIEEWKYYDQKGVAYWSMIDPCDGTIPSTRTIDAKSTRTFTNDWNDLAFLKNRLVELGGEWLNFRCYTYSIWAKENGLEIGFPVGSVEVAESESWLFQMPRFAELVLEWIRRNKEWITTSQNKKSKT